MKKKVLILFMFSSIVLSGCDSKDSFETTGELPEIKEVLIETEESLSTGVSEDMSEVDDNIDNLDRLSDVNKYDNVESESDIMTLSKDELSIEDAKHMLNNFEAPSSYRLNAFTNLEADVDLSALGVDTDSEDIGVSISVEQEVLVSDIAIHDISVCDYSLLGTDETLIEDRYINLKSKPFRAYTLDNETNKWENSELKPNDKFGSDIICEILDGSSGDSSSSYDIIEQDEDTITISVVTSGVNALIDKESINDMLGNMALDDIKLESTIKLQKETGYPLLVYIDITDALNVNRDDLSSESINILDEYKDISKFEVRYEFSDFNDVTVTLPNGLN